jgi:CBS domain-containing protein
MSKKLIVVSEDASLDAAYSLMKRHDIRHLPVVNDDGGVIGILSDRDLQRALKSHVSGIGLTRWESCEFDSSLIVSDYMTWPVKSVDLSAPLKSVVEMMIGEKISSILVSSSSGVVGIVTTIDLLRFLVELLGDDEKSWKMSLENVFRRANFTFGAAAQSLANAGI